MDNSTELKNLLNQLTNKRNLNNSNKMVVNAFVKKLGMATMWYDSEYHDGVAMLKILLEDSNLIESAKFNENFSMNVLDMVPTKLKDNKTFKSVIEELTNVKGKGVGVGELVMTLLVKDWEYSSSDSDGICGGIAREVKNAKLSCLKPVLAGLTDKGLIDKLNKKYWGTGIPAGPRKTHDEFLKVLKQNPSKFMEYATALYPNANVQDLYNQVVANLDNLDRDRFNTIHGLWVLNEYKKIDGWGSLVLVHPDTLNITNIAKIDESVITKHGVKFSAIMSRGKDSNAVPDGYSKISAK